MREIREMAMEILQEEQSIRESQRRIRTQKGELLEKILREMGPVSAVESGTITLNTRRINQMFR
jgi:hypothetical protein